MHHLFLFLAWWTFCFLQEDKAFHFMNSKFPSQFPLASQPHCKTEAWSSAHFILRTHLVSPTHPHSLLISNFYRHSKTLNCQLPQSTFSAQHQICAHRFVFLREKIICVPTAWGPFAIPSHLCSDWPTFWATNKRPGNKQKFPFQPIRISHTHAHPHPPVNPLTSHKNTLSLSVRFSCRCIVHLHWSGLDLCLPQTVGTWDNGKWEAIFQVLLIERPYRLLLLIPAYQHILERQPLTSTPGYLLHAT